MCQDTLTKLQKNKSHIAQEVSKKNLKTKTHVIFLEKVNVD